MRGEGEKSYTKMQRGKESPGNKFIAWLHYIAANKVIYPKRPHFPKLTTLIPAMGEGMEIKEKKKVYLKLQIP
jgi:hypothetical protein